MKLPMIEALRTKRIGTRVPVTPRLSMVVMENVDFATPVQSYREVFRSAAIFQIDQIADDERAIPHLQKQAERVLMHEVYGPVHERLMEVLKMLYEAGPAYDDKVVKAIDALISDLQP